MISGENTGSRWQGLPALFLVWLFLPGTAPMSATETWAQAETDRAGGSRGWTVEQLLEGLARSRPAEARFTETAFSTLLTEPLKTRGILRFTPPASLEKHVTAPHEARYLVDGDRVFFENKATGATRTLSLHDAPGLRAFVEAWRSTLANDVVALKRAYRVTLQGEPRRWVLILHPRDAAVQELVESVRFSGKGEQVQVVEIQAPDGDRSVMVIATDAP